MNSKTAKLLRKAAGYRNQTATPGTMPFPGVARGYKHPVYATRTARKSSYIYHVGEWLKVFTDVTRMVHNHREKPVLEMEVRDGVPQPKEALIAVSKPGMLNPQQPKGVYRGLKRIERRVGLLRLARWLRGADDSEISRLVKDMNAFIAKGVERPVGMDGLFEGDKA